MSSFAIGAGMQKKILVLLKWPSRANANPPPPQYELFMWMGGGFYPWVNAGGHDFLALGNSCNFFCMNI